jgi:hypothetical protein
MIAPLRKPRHPSSAPAWHEHFLPMLPAIRKQAHVAFRSLDPEARNEAVQEVIANCLVAYERLWKLGKSDVAYPTPLANFAIRQVRAGRRVGGRLNIRDISSLHCRSVKGIRLGRLDRYDQEEEAWLEVLVQDRRATPADVAAITGNGTQRSSLKFVRICSAAGSASPISRRSGCQSRESGPEALESHLAGDYGLRS